MPSILAVDDDPSIVALYEQLLSVEGHEVATASSGEEALSKLKRRRFDLLILDIMMPGMSGYEVLERLQETPSRADIPVVVVTAKHDAAGVQREMEHGATDHLAKPFHPHELEEAVLRALRGGPSTTVRRRQVAAEAEVYGSMDILFQEARDTAHR